MITGTSAAQSALPIDAAAAVPDDGSAGAATRMQVGAVYFSNDHYGVLVYAGGTVEVTNLASGEMYVAWGPPPPGAPPFDFEGYTTLVLEDGTKLTVHTAPWDAASPLTRPDRVLIVSGDYGVEVQGLAGGANTLCYVETQDLGWLIDAIVPDGGLVFENPDGPGLQDEGGHGLWDAPAPPPVPAPPVGSFGPLAGSHGQALLKADGLKAISFMGRFRGAPVFQPRDANDRSSSTPAELRRHRELEAALWRLVLARQDGRVCCLGPMLAGVHPSWGVPGWARGPGTT